MKKYGNAQIFKVKKNGFVFLILILSIVLFWIFKNYLTQQPNLDQGQSDLNLMRNWKVYENKDIGLTFKYPKDFFSTKSTAERNTSSFNNGIYILELNISEFSGYKTWIETIKKDIQNKELNVRNQKLFGKDVYIESRQTSGSIFERNIFIVNGSSIVHISLQADENKISGVANKVEDLSDQILSTIKFTNILVDAQILTKSNDDNHLEYKNNTYKFSFLFPNTWDAYLDENNMSIKTRICDGCTGKSNEIILNYLDNSKAYDTYLAYEKYPSINANLTIYLNREAPTAGTQAQEAYIYNSANKSIIKMFCGQCDTETMNNILSTFKYTD